MLNNYYICLIIIIMKFANKFNTSLFIIYEKILFNSLISKAIFWYKSCLIYFNIITKNSKL